MATYETKGRLTYKDENSDNHIIYPVTKMDCIEDMPDIEKEVAESVAAYLEENPVETPDITAQVERAEAAATTAEAAKESVNTSVNLAGGYASSASSYAVRAENAATRAEEAAASIPESGGGTVKTVNGVEPDENGNVEITIPGSGGEDIESIDVPGDGTVEIHRADGNVDCYPFTSAYNVKTVNGTAPDENGNVEITIPDSGGNVDQSGGGLSATASALLITILRAATYPDDNDQSANITALEAALAEIPETPDVGVEQTGTILSIVSGVTVSQSGSVLDIA